MTGQQPAMRGMIAAMAVTAPPLSHRARSQAAIHAIATRPGWRLTDRAAWPGLAAPMPRDPAHRRRLAAGIALAVRKGASATFARDFRAAIDAPGGARRQQ